MKYSLIKPFYAILIELLKCVDRQPLKNIAVLINEHLIFSLIHPKIKKISISNDNDEESLSGNFLPAIKSNYTYTLVLDLDETLIHFFYVIIIVLYILDTRH